MATKHGDIEIGKLGNKIYYTWHGRQCERAMPSHVSNPQTEAQQAHRSSFALISKLSSYMKEAHLIGLHHMAVREHNSTYALFRRLNKACFTSDGDIDYPQVAVSRGPVAGADILSAVVDADGRLTVTFAPRGGDASDSLYLFAYNPTLCAGFLADPVPRSAGRITVDLPTEWLQTAATTDNTNTFCLAPQETRPATTEEQTHSHNQTFHLYAFLQGYRLRTSDTIYRMLQ